MAVNDPWGVNASDGEKQTASETESEPSISNDVSDTKANRDNSFGDNFVDNKLPDNRLHGNVDENQDNSSLSFTHLQDSREYIDRLELKLRKLQKVSLQNALSERKSDEARRLLDARLQSLDYLSAATTTYSESNVEEEVEDNPVLRKLCPERQAVNLSELEKLLDADSLQKLVEELNSSDQETLEENKDKDDAKNSNVPK